MNFIFMLFDDEAKEFCEDIVNEMVRLHSISKDEAIKRVNNHWSHIDMIGGEEELIFHEDPTFWAQDIYYGSESRWWLAQDKRDEMGLPKLEGKKLN